MPSNPHQTYELIIQRPVYPLLPPAPSSGGTGCSENKMLMKPINKKQIQNQPPHFTSLPLFLALQKLNLKLKPNSKTNEQGHFYPQPTFQNIYNPKQNHQTEINSKNETRKEKGKTKKSGSSLSSLTKNLNQVNFLVKTWKATF